MPDAWDHHRHSTDRLRERIAASLALDDVMASELGRTAMVLAARGDHEGARALIEAARRHRVGAIKHRALMSAQGLEI